ncbi:hypothetical protein D3C85_1461590 [compost metagenome]
MQVPRAHIHQSTGVNLTTDYFTKLVGWDNPGFMPVTEIFKVFSLCFKGLELRLSVSKVAKPPPQVALDFVLLNPTSNEFN